MVLRFAAIVLLSLGAGINCSAQNKCCTCVDDQNGTRFQIAQSAGCAIGCKASRGTAVGVQACWFNSLPPGSYPVPPAPDRTCDPYWLQIAGDCKGNHWCQCRLTITQVTSKAVAGDPITFEFVNDNLGQEYGTRFVGRSRISVGGSVDWGDHKPASSLDSGKYRLNHVYDKPGTYVISAEIHGDFKWNNTSEGASCSYRDRTAPVSLTVVVSARAPQNDAPKANSARTN